MPRHITPHHLAGGAGARAAPLSETVDHDAFPHAGRDVLRERPASRDSRGELEPDSIPYPRGAKRITAVDTDSAEKSSTRPGKSALLTRATPRATARQAATLTTSAWDCGRTGSRRSARTGSRRAPICGGYYKRLGSRRRSARISCGIPMPPIC